MPQTPDAATTPVAAQRELTGTVQEEIELRAGVEPIEALHDERRHLVQLNSRVRAMHGSNGIYKDVRDLELAKAGARVRENWTGEKAPSEAYVAANAPLDKEYQRWLEQQVSDKAHFEVIDDRITAITEMINRGQALLRYVSSEPK